MFSLWRRNSPKNQQLLKPIRSMASGAYSPGQRAATGATQQCPQPEAQLQRFAASNMDLPHAYKAAGTPKNRSTGNLPSPLPISGCMLFTPSTTTAIYRRSLGLVHSKEFYLGRLIYTLPRRQLESQGQHLQSVGLALKLKLPDPQFLKFRKPN